MKNSTKRKRRKTKGIVPWPLAFRTFFTLLGYKEIYKFNPRTNYWEKTTFSTGLYYPQALYFLWKEGLPYAVPLECTSSSSGFFDGNGEISILFSQT